jgi:hypothetical protein
VPTVRAVAFGDDARLARHLKSDLSAMTTGDDFPWVHFRAIWQSIDWHILSLSGLHDVMRHEGA